MLKLSHTQANEFHDRYYWCLDVISQVQEVYDEAGVWGFWKGVIPTLIMVSKTPNMLLGDK